MASSTLWKIFYSLRNLFFFSMAILLMTNAVLELIFAPVMTFRYYLPSLFRIGSTDPLMTTFYSISILVQVFNFLAAVFLFGSILLTNYNEKWLAYDTMSLVSVVLSLSLVSHHQLTGVDFYQRNVEKDIYMQVATIGDIRCSRRYCYNTDVYTWHQGIQCCGWYSATDLEGMVDSKNELRLPQFCCFQNATQSANSTCNIGAIHRFREPCAKNRTSFLMFRGVGIIGHPSSTSYSAFKLITTLVFTFAKKHYLFPQSEGIYSHYVPA